MDFELSDSSGTDDDLPPSHQNKIRNGRSLVATTAPLPRIQNDMEIQIHLIEQEAYSSVLRAFKAQSDAITWEMESLITELRKELRVSDEEHRNLLSRVNADDIIKRIREWRNSNGLQPGMFNNPTASASHKKPKTSHSGVSAPPSALPQPMQPSSSALIRPSGSGLRAKKPKPYGSTGFTEDNSSDPLIGRKVWTRWPEDNNFYEAVITDFNPIEGRHALVYDANTPNEASEWVNLREISPNDIRWKREDVGISRRDGRSGTGRGTTVGFGRGRGIVKGGQSKNEPPVSQNGIRKRSLNDIEILHTDTLVKEVEKVFSSSHADPMDIDKARKLLKEHEQALVDAIAKLEGASDGENDREGRRKVGTGSRDGPNQQNGGEEMQ